MSVGVADLATNKQHIVNQYFTSNS